MGGEKKGGVLAEEFRLPVLGGQGQVQMWGTNLPAG